MPMSPGTPGGLGVAGSDGGQMSLEGIAVSEPSRRCGQWDFPSRHAGCAGFLHRGLDLKALGLNSGRVSLGGAPSPRFLTHYY